MRIIIESTDDEMEDGDKRLRLWRGIVVGARPEDCIPIAVVLQSVLTDDAHNAALMREFADAGILPSRHVKEDVTIHRPLSLPVTRSNDVC